MLIDIDSFKRINDTSGHLAGDDIIKSVGALIAGSVRRSDVAARYGGDEFAIILPGASRGDAVHIAERIRSLLSIKKWSLNQSGGSDGVTVSIGIASLCPSDSAKELFERADASLYKAKASGRRSRGGALRARRPRSLSRRADASRRQIIDGVPIPVLHFGAYRIHYRHGGDSRRKRR